MRKKITRQTLKIAYNEFKTSLMSLKKLAGKHDKYLSHYIKSRCL